MTNPNKAELRRLTIQRDMMGTIHIKSGDFDYVQIRYQYPYTDNASTQRLAEQVVAILEGCSEVEQLRAERDAALAELEAIKSSGWRNHSVNYARAEKCPQTLETAQAAWDRDQELIEEQRQQIAKDSQTINDLRQRLESLRIQVSTLTEWYSNALDLIGEVTAAIPGVTYMDPPDGGDVSIPEQIRRMAKDAELYRWISSGVQEAETLVSVVLCHGGDSRKVAERIAVYMEANQEAPNA